MGKKFSYPLEHHWISKDSKSHGYPALDFGWSTAWGGPNMPIYSVYDGEVISIQDGLGNTGVGYGNLIMIKHSSTEYSLYAHLLKGSLLVKVGDKVKLHQPIAKMNNSGHSNGSHLHFEMRIGGSAVKYRVDPLTVCYLYTDFQDMTESSLSKYNVMTYTPTPRFGTPINRDTKKDQVEVISSVLRARVGAGLSEKTLGYMNIGVYDINRNEIVRGVDGYDWAKVEGQYFFALGNKLAKFYPAEDEKDKIIEALRAENSILVKERDRRQNSIMKINDEVKPYIG